MGMERLGLSHHETKEPTSQDEAENVFLKGIERLRQERARTLADRWENEYEQLSANGANQEAFDNLFSRFETFREKREEALFSLEIPDGLDERLTREMRQFDAHVTLSFRNPSLFLGNGATAEVYEVVGHPNICVKFITNQKEYNDNNHLRTEFKLLNEASVLHTGPVRTPVPYFLRIHPREGHSLGMERVDGKSLSQILEKPGSCPDLLTLAKMIDRDTMIQNLKDFISELHHHGITHNDLRLRNMMLDRSGNLFVIDFGKARREENESRRDIFEQSDLTLAQGELQRFFQEIDKIYI